MSCFIVLAGYDCFVINLEEIIKNASNRFWLFPTALQDVLSSLKWKEIIPQVVEWLHKLSRWKEMPLPYKEILEQSILALKNFEYCKNDSKWPRFFDFRTKLFINYDMI